RQVGEGLEVGPGQQHHAGLVVDDHRRGVLVGEPGVELEAELGEEGFGGLEIGDRQVDEQVAGHRLLLWAFVRRPCRRTTAGRLIGRRADAVTTSRPGEITTVPYLTL